MAWIESRFRVVQGKKTREKLFFVCDRISGKKVSEPAGPIYATAKKIKQERENKKAKSYGGIIESPPIKVAYDEFEITIKKDQDKSPRTWGAYSWGVDKFLEWLGNTHRPVDSISKPELIKFRTKIMQGHKTNGMINILKYVRTFFSFCVKAGYIQINPVSEALDGFEETKVASYYTDAHIRHIIDTAKAQPGIAEGFRKKAIEEFCDIITIGLTTGLREFEISGLLSEKCIRPEIGVLGKGRKWRNIPIADEKVWIILEKYIARSQERVFQDWSTDRIKQCWKRLIKRAKKTGKLPDRCRFHDLRHTFATNFLQDGGRLEDLQEIMGHANFSTTQRYKHAQRSHLLKEMAKMKNTFMEAVPPKFRVA